MLQLLHIENIAVIERADIEFTEGFNVLTGETGAGKSIVIDALNAVTGSRVSKDLVRTGAPASVVTAVFTAENAGEWCEENGVEPEDDGLFIQRKITAEGKTTCRVNGVPVSVSQLRELGLLLLDVHGQNDGRKLMDESSHRGYLDAYGGLEGELREYAEAYNAMRAKQEEIDALNMDESEKERRMDMLRYQIDELERANLQEGEKETLEARRELLKNASRLTDDLDTAFAALYGGDDSYGAAALLSEAENAVSGASRYAEKLKELSERLREIVYASQDIAEELRDFRESLDFSPMELDEIESRLDTLRRLSRKYGGDETEMLRYLEEIREELDEIEYSSDKIVKLEKELNELCSKASKLAAKLSESRKAAAKTLEERISAELSQLSMKGTRFAVQILPLNSESGLSSAGCDNVRFLISANAGEEPGRISKIASGGELSRIMLAMKNVLSEGEPAGTLVFDEIDTGVSGIAAQRVGEKICDLAGTKQILCVTHLPQIAAMADTHFEIVKQVEDNRTYTYVNRLDEDGRTHELARLTGGENITATTLASASELICAAQEYKANRK